jgi:hypothetical protein
MHSFLSDLYLFAHLVAKVLWMTGLGPGIALALAAEEFPYLIPRIQSPDQIAALRRCKSKDAYKALVRELERVAERSRQAGLKAKQTANRKKAA